jgi:hypothetical protein
MRFIFGLMLLISINTFAQCKSYIISVKGDTLNCVDMKELKQGRWVVHVESIRGEIGYEEEGVFIDGRKDGPWRRYSLVGDLISIENYRWGSKDGKNIYFNNMGNLLREENWRAVDPKNPYDTVAVYDVNDPTKIVGTTIVKLEGASVKQGTWTFYDPDFGTIVKTENWWLDKPANQAGNGSVDDLAPIDPTKKSTAEKTLPKPKEVLEFEKKNSGKKKIKVRDGRTGG